MAAAVATILPAFFGSLARLDRLARLVVCAQCGSQERTLIFCFLLLFKLLGALRCLPACLPATLVSSVGLVGLFWFQPNQALELALDLVV